MHDANWDSNGASNPFGIIDATPALVWIIIFRVMAELIQLGHLIDQVQVGMIMTTSNKSGCNDSSKNFVLENKIADGRGIVD